MYEYETPVWVLYALCANIILSVQYGYAVNFDENSLETNAAKTE